MRANPASAATLATINAITALPDALWPMPSPVPVSGAAMPTGAGVRCGTTVAGATVLTGVGVLGGTSFGVLV
jgi:hypothetical protein